MGLRAPLFTLMLQVLQCTFTASRLLTGPEVAVNAFGLRCILGSSCLLKQTIMDHTVTVSCLTRLFGEEAALLYIADYYVPVGKIMD